MTCRFSPVFVTFWIEFGKSGEAKAIVTQAQIAELGLGSRKRVGRLLRKFEERVLIEMHYGAISIRSVSLLRQFGYDERSR
jgi:hypothetical protein